MTSSSEYNHHTTPSDDGVVLSVSTSLVDSSEEVRESHEEYGDEMSCDEKRILCIILKPAPPLPYPLKKLPMHSGLPAMEYQIPDEAKEEVLHQLFPFTECPSLEDTRFDLHEGKEFQVKDYKVIRERGRNMLVSPYYGHSGGMVVDWMKNRDSDCSCDQILPIPDILQ